MKKGWFKSGACLAPLVAFAIACVSSSQSVDPRFLAL